MLFSFEGTYVFSKGIVGVNDGEVPPVPIPNTAVKLAGADDTRPEAARENMSMPTQKQRRGFSPLFFFAV